MLKKHGAHLGTVYGTNTDCTKQRVKIDRIRHYKIVEDDRPQYLKITRSVFMYILLH